MQWLRRILPCVQQVVGKRDKATSSDVKKEIVHKTFDNVSLETMLGEMAEYYGVRFHIPQHSEFCTAIGAGLNYFNQKEY